MLLIWFFEWTLRRKLTVHSALKNQFYQTLVGMPTKEPSKTFRPINDKLDKDQKDYISKKSIALHKI